MTPDSTAPQDMTDEQLIEAIAREVMGWEFRSDKGHECWYNGYFESKRVAGRMLYRVTADKRWNPLTDWNHTMEVVQHFKNSLFSKRVRFTDALSEQKKTQDGHCYAWPDAFVHLTQRDICVAALSAVRSL